ncbi:hypothetical protein ABGB17_22365 [Sphaerisporangium sp. B11E5]|uniref:hypothetical protein n=1 Tax=Sphaerisporangium sp. B11E5 TaxID=3153563 RepID=UPI00325DBB15
METADLAAPGRVRRLALTVGVPLLVLVVPLVMLALYGERLPDKAYIGRDGIYPQYADDWGTWGRSRAFAVVFQEAIYLTVFWYNWRWTEMQRFLTVLSIVTSVWASVTDLVDISSLVDATGPVTGPGWAIPVEVAVTAAAGVLGWWAAGPSPTPPQARSAPPPGVPVLALTSGTRAVFTAGSWSRPALAWGAAFLTLAVGLSFLEAERGHGVVLFGVIGISAILAARTLLRVDGKGVELTLPLVGGLRRALVPFRAIWFADVRPAGANPGLYGKSWGFGHVAGPGPVLVLYLTDGRMLVYSTRDAAAGAALVNGILGRERQGTGGC